MNGLNNQVHNKTKSLQLENANIKKLESLLSPRELKKKVKITKEVKELVIDARNTICRILDGTDPRLLAIVGPCSIHNSKAALEYAKQLKTIRDAIQDRIYLVMRVYFEKPRTTLGWRGLFIDPNMDNSNNIPEGLRLGRSILLEINRLGLSCGSEYLDPIIPNYIDDLVCWASIGARTIESQTHRDMASGLSVPVGFKNSTSGDIDTAINAIVLSSTERGFIGANIEGKTCIVHTMGNSNTHLILRGGRTGPNYFPQHIQNASKLMKKHNIDPRIMIDCSHDNSLKDYKNQEVVLQSVLEQYISGEKSLRGFMLESNLKEGNQKIIENKKKLVYGKSVTDACIDIHDTKRLLFAAHENLKNIPERYINSVSKYGG